MTRNRLTIPAAVLFFAAVGFICPINSSALQPSQPGYGQDYGGNAPRGPYFGARRRGFQEGLEGALRDFDNHRRPDPNNRDEFRHPPVPYQLQDAYRDGFRRGYQVTMSALMGGGNGYGQGPAGDARLRGFQDGMEGALRDFDNHRRPDPNNRDEYRHPHVPYGLQGAYRDGFQRGYQIAMSGLMGMPNR